ncbi:hypoxanthine-guanine phosphoribosyltransferase [Thioflexithrix psekupsensis]|uniref:Hypoxanthine-guanine phosphoribosyltransferase n=1 Tax=Thioflexithrix psekupsensis TaxID=1570016 RepID=A0A251X7S9_9GAMM|nr:hypoxanthine-guanine phosphoribosyltransferase [Thioflexithrix psekupsensis]OUD14031.1 hypoxanthine-guanine phosphoribosyltransferase [Thioflexithrix psekupsensis]
MNINTVLTEADCLHSLDTVIAAIDHIAEQIDRRMQTELLRDKPLVCLSVMLGGLIFTGHLLPKLKTPLIIDYIHATRYQGETQGADLKWLKYPSVNLQGETVLIIDDILDEGLTLKSLVDYCEQQGAKQVFTAVLVEKQLPMRRGLPQADFVGLLVPNRYVFGFGMDYHEHLRSAAGIFAVKNQ